MDRLQSSVDLHRPPSAQFLLSSSSSKESAAISREKSLGFSLPLQHLLPTPLYTTRAVLHKRNKKRGSTTAQHRALQHKAQKAPSGLCKNQRLVRNPTPDLRKTITGCTNRTTQKSPKNIIETCTTVFGATQNIAERPVLALS